MMMLNLIRPALDRRAARAIAQRQICAELIDDVLAAPLPYQERRLLERARVEIEAGRLFTASASTAIDQALYGLATALDDDARGFGAHDHQRRTLQEAFDALYALAGVLETISDAATSRSGGQDVRLRPETETRGRGTPASGRAGENSAATERPARPLKDLIHANNLAREDFFGFFPKFVSAPDRTNRIPS